MTTSTGKYLEDISHSHIVSSMYKLKTSATDSDDLSIELDRDRNGRQRKLTNNKNVKGKIILQLCSNIFLVLPNTKKKLLKVWVIN